ncbi:MAG TPA: sugar ABC transporter ATP-binding protein [Spirochaetia bacterium]|nr:sugar ABC transporter ATP-binding protein [Spirochaetia bacterium]
MSDPIVEVEQLNKDYSGVMVLRDFSLEIRRGEVHALIGHNGAGKSTVIRLLSGTERPSSGQILVSGKKVSLFSPRVAKNFGIYTVFQELSLIPELTIAQNMFLGKELSSFGLLQKKDMETRAHEVLKAYHLHHLDPGAKVKSLSHAEQQLVEIASALNNDASLILLDEPSSALHAAEIDQLLDAIRNLASQGVAFLFVTHKIEEALSVCTQITVLRNGGIITSAPVEQIEFKHVFELIAGCEFASEHEHYREKTECGGADVMLDIRGLYSDVIHIPSFTVTRGQIVGLYGLVGSGRTELLETLFGLRPYGQGQIYLGNRPYRPRSPMDAIRRGVFLLTEERKRSGIVPQMNSRINMVLASLNKFQRFGFLQGKRIVSRSDEYRQKLSIRGDCDQPIERMSGGNQQKVLLARWLIPDGQLLLLDEPTKGVDIGAKVEIHSIIRNIADDGYTVIIASSEAEEIRAVADIAVVMAGGTVTTVLNRDDITEDRLFAESIGQRLSKGFRAPFGPEENQQCSNSGDSFAGGLGG